MSYLAAIEAVRVRAEQAAKLLKDHDDLSKVVVVPKNVIEEVRRLIGRCIEGTPPNTVAEKAGYDAALKLKPYTTP